MRRKVFIIVIFTIAMLGALGFIQDYFYKEYTECVAAQTQKDIYYCPMHPGYTSDRPGDCPICNMKLVKKQKAQEIEEKTTAPKEVCVLHNCPMANCPMIMTGDIKKCPFCGEHLNQSKKILYYRNPMNSEVTSSVPMKDEMGMDYIPVYEEEKIEGASGVAISSEKQQFIGVKKESVQKRRLIREIKTAGRIAYDPDLFVAQQEYIEALKAAEKMKDSNIDIIKKEMKALADAAKRKLVLLGMNEKQIEELAKENKAQENLYLGVDADTVWVYMNIYEYESGLIKEGLPVEIEAVAYPGEKFEGEIISISPVLDPTTRSINIRSEINNPEHKLKPQMFVDAKIKVDLGERLAVSDEAVLATGERTIVFVDKSSGYFESRPVKLGHKAEGYYEVLDGLKEGEIVVTSGNFFIDSESRLKTAISGESHQHGQ